MSTNPLQQLTEAGVSIWLDDLSRERIETGNLADLVKNSFVVEVGDTEHLKQCISRLRNVESDTRMRESIARDGTFERGQGQPRSRP